MCVFIGCVEVDEVHAASGYADLDAPFFYFLARFFKSKLLLAVDDVQCSYPVH